ncbi:VOC family protein [Iodobacter sp. CM08]|uniref:VOC family protein n=1 Tax=Iodobacter sp. CM08 TaxID=3085902 RepID=UPI002981DF31|nr:VOC family protein [Iodobacter sp. CM08]MDW5417084.1 VOC family protein [Iodobacter sp. CM08]
MHQHHKVNYIEMPSRDLNLSKAFFTKVFGWAFVDYGPEYCAFSNEGIDGGFYYADLAISSQSGAPLIVLYSNQLEATQSAVLAAGGELIKAIFSFPGGRRFQFKDPAGNEFAVWSE